MGEPQVERAGVRVAARAGELARDPVRGLEPDLLVDADLGDRLEIRMPAVVH